ncbi:MAG TPA: hypothetical protein VHH90_02490 [Polyangia bacterium]|nr:hypothetical protein [Polyangia bacterium]
MSLRRRQSGWAIGGMCGLGGLLVAAAGCGAKGGQTSNVGVTTPLAADGAVPTTTTGRYQPLSVGASWIYQVTDTNNVAYTKTSDVTAFEDVGGAFAGTMTYKTSETVKSTTQYTWYQMTDTDVRRLHDQTLDSSGAQSTDDWYTPYDLRIDETPEHLTPGAAWQLSYADAHTSAKKPAKTTMITENWSCDAVNETVTVPAGTFSAVRITRVDTASGGSAKTQWFVPGVGKVREENNSGHLEVLTSYHLPDAADAGQASP